MKTPSCGYCLAADYHAAGSREARFGCNGKNLESFADCGRGVLQKAKIWRMKLQNEMQNNKPA
jgi:hypothetical protein